jgi:amino acid transporter
VKDFDRFTYCFEHHLNKKSMKRIVLVYGIIAGLIVGAMFFVTAPFYNNGTLNSSNGMAVGYASMVVALSLVFFGVKSYRDQHQKGEITFGRAFKVGILITLVATVLYALSWEVAYSTVSKGYAEKMTTEYIEKAKAEAKSEAELQATITEMEQYKKMYESILFRFPMSMIEILPVGLLITLVSATLLKRKNFLPPTESASN